MPRPLAYLLLSCLCGCETLPTLAEPQLQIAPYLASYQLRGKTAMDTVSGSSVTRNAPQDLSSFGLGHHEDEFGIRGDIGNGFSGLRLDYLRIDSYTSKRGVLSDNWGALQTGDLGGMYTVMDEFRLGYAHEVLREKFDFRKLEDIEFRLAPALVLAHRSLTLQGFEETRTRAQNLNATDAGRVYPALRARLQYQQVALDVEYALSPHDFDFGGDFTGLLQDFEARLSYGFELHDVELFVGYRRSEFGVDGNEGGQEYTGDFVLDGFQVGFRVGF